MVEFVFIVEDVNKKNMSVRSQLISSWDQLCDAAAQGESYIDLPNTKYMDIRECMGRHRTYIFDNNVGSCSEVMPVSNDDTFATSADIRKQTVNRSYFIALAPARICKQIERAISNTTTRVYELSGNCVMTTEIDSQSRYVNLSFTEVEDQEGTKRRLMDQLIEPIDDQGVFLASFIEESILMKPNIDAIALRADMKHLELQWLVMYGTPCDDRNLFLEVLAHFEIMTAESVEQPTPIPATSDPDIIESYKNLKKYTVKSFETVRKVQKPSAGALGDMLVKQPQDDTQYRIRYTTSGRESLIQSAFEKDLKKTNKKIFGVIYDAKNDKFIGLVERTK